MSWKTSRLEEEKLKFIVAWLGGEFSFSELCNRYGISRKTGYKLVNRYRVEGETALKERSRTRHHHPNQLSEEMVNKILSAKHLHLTWGPRKLRDWFLLEDPTENYPAISTIGLVLERHGLVKRKKYRRRVPAHSEPLKHCKTSNDLWSVDFKGQFRLGNGEYCYPLTIFDNYSRYLLECKGLTSPNKKETRSCFERVFREYGLPDAIRSDNGQPFAGVGIGGLSALSVWWLKLGILPERIEPGCPEQNGRHERMHRTQKEETANPPKEDFLSQQKHLDAFRAKYNNERPHEALKGKRPRDIYKRAEKEMPNKVPEMSYPDEMSIRKVRQSGEIKFKGKFYYVSQLLVNEAVGLEAIDDERALIYFGRLKLGVVDVRLDKITRP